LFRGRQTGFKPRVDPRLPPPGIDRLLADPEIRGDFRYFPTAFDQLYYAPPELRRVSPPCHIVSPRDYGSRVQLSTSGKPSTGQSLKSKAKARMGDFS
jgi:hypothetical protein